MKKLLLLLLLFPTLLIAQPQSFLAGTNINIDATKGVSICSGTDDVKVATSCSGGGTQYTHTFNGTTGRFESTGGMSLPDGTAAAPALTFTSDTNTGLYRISADRIGVTLGGTQEISITSSAMTPAAAAGLSLGSASLPFGELLTGSGTINASLSYSNGESAGVVGTTTNHNLSVRTNGLTKMTVKTDGNVRLDTTASGIILKSPDGTCSLCTVSNADVMTCASVTC
jgi:hypothetical protein